MKFFYQVRFFLPARGPLAYQVGAPRKLGNTRSSGHIIESDTQEIAVSRKISLLTIWPPFQTYSHIENEPFSPFSSHLFPNVKSRTSKTTVKIAEK